jgi:hypothetical protein
MNELRVTGVRQKSSGAVVVRMGDGVREMTVVASRRTPAELQAALSDLGGQAHKFLRVSSALPSMRCDAVAAEAGWDDAGAMCKAKVSVEAVLAGVSEPWRWSTPFSRTHGGDCVPLSKDARAALLRVLDLGRELVKGDVAQLKLDLWEDEEEVADEAA